MKQHAKAALFAAVFLIGVLGFVCGQGLGIGTAPGAALPPQLGAGTILHDVRPGAGVTRTTWLSEWFEALAGTPADTRVFILDSGKPGAVVFVAGGTHANEIAGILTAVTLVENAVPQSGKLIVIPDLNNSASTWTESNQVPAWIAIQTANGTRFFKYGARLTNIVHQGSPDPESYRHPDGGDVFEGWESRNLNRAYPGAAQGALTQKLACAVMELLKRENIDVAFDLHEAGPESRLANMIVANPKNLDMAAFAVLNLELDGFRMKLEPSSDTFHGLSHREWGDRTQAASFLIETPNPAQSNNAANPAEDPSYPLKGRVMTHLASIEAILDAWNMMNDAGRTITFAAWPSRDVLNTNGLGSILK